jgi:hypothetical protein
MIPHIVTKRQLDPKRREFDISFTRRGYYTPFLHETSNFKKGDRFILDRKLPFLGSIFSLCVIGVRPFLYEQLLPVEAVSHYRAAKHLQGGCRNKSLVQAILVKAIVRKFDDGC